MLFHVTITHRQDDCPGRYPGESPWLIDSADQVEALANELSITQHSLAWGAACILWAEPEHVAYALLEAANLEAIQHYISALVPTGWTTRVLPVFWLPSQLAMVRELLAVPAVPVVQPQESVPEPPDERDIADTLEGVTVGPQAESPHDEPVDQRVTRATPQPVVPQPVIPPAAAPPDRPAIPDPSAVTRFVERPALLEGFGSESSTVILEAKAQPTVGLRLVAVTGPAEGAVFEIGESGATLGRLPENSIYLTDGRLSRHHARIEFRDGGYWLSDLGSQNGTLVNDRPLTEAHQLQAGDSIELGTSRLLVKDQHED
jgi:hypothetical protein